MTTVNDMITRAHRRLAVIDINASLSSTEAATGLQAFNDMLYSWQSMGCNLLLQSDFALSDTFYLFVPPLDADSDTIKVLSYRGTWDASANSPTLASSTGTEGYAYRVTTAGSTTLDDVTSWAVNDYAVYDGQDWLKSVNSRQFEAAVIALLAMRLADEYGVQSAPTLVQDARRGWLSIQSYYVKPDAATFDAAIRHVPSRTFANTYEGINN